MFQEWRDKHSKFSLNLTNSLLPNRGIHTAHRFCDSGVKPLIILDLSAQIKASGNVNGITMEWMGLSMKPDQFLKLAKAAKLEFRIGTTSLPLTDKHVEIIHNFANQITVQ